MKLRFDYETYQDVRRNLFLYSTPVLVGSGFFAYWLILPGSHREVINKLFANFPAESWLKGASGVVLFSVIAFVLTELLQVHDKLYDRFVVKWRFRYATDFILPRLIQPFACHVSRRFHDIAEKNIRQFQEKLYYPYVGDRDSLIGKNKLVRFYEVVTIYWLTQMNELILLFLLLLAVAYRVIGPTNPEYRASLLDAVLIIVGALVANRVWVYLARNKVRQATDDEIDAIIEEHREDLGRRIRSVCEEYGIPFQEPGQV